MVVADEAHAVDLDPERDLVQEVTCRRIPDPDDPSEAAVAMRDRLGEQLVDAAWELTDDGLLLTDFELPSSPAASWWFSEYLSLPMTRIE